MTNQAVDIARKEAEAFHREHNLMKTNMAVDVAR